MRSAARGVVATVVIFALSAAARSGVPTSPGQLPPLSGDNLNSQTVVLPREARTGPVPIRGTTNEPTSWIERTHAAPGSYAHPSCRTPHTRTPAHLHTCRPATATAATLLRGWARSPFRRGRPQSADAVHALALPAATRIDESFIKQAARTKKRNPKASYRGGPVPSCGTRP